MASTNGIVAKPRLTKVCLRGGCKKKLTQKKGEGKPQFKLRTFCSVKCSNSRAVPPKPKTGYIPAGWGFA